MAVSKPRNRKLPSGSSFGGTFPSIHLGVSPAVKGSVVSLSSCAYTEFMSHTLEPVKSSGTMPMSVSSRSSIQPTSGTWVDGLVRPANHCQRSPLSSEVPVLNSSW